MSIVVGDEQVGGTFVVSTHEANRIRLLERADMFSTFII